ncbi:uncharacterized protein F5Z01DRAFT_487808 [Emericellopsis atlantica]|uniref:Uncharacterized protein n=1 Tax=Emericellopsis atlantica TaxID=2614577 RepID=A0A9P7ZR30_9HYPO|nr:uncharacterized protein F5Z01DRAFT_487808 [Emericellopsis atlantica]KAG9256774.1 hypothetical protein F5Z01DRAFT_487808 [Emericellopsis atlantica]
MARGDGQGNICTSFPPSLALRATATLASGQLKKLHGAEARERATSPRVRIAKVWYYVRWMDECVFLHARQLPHPAEKLGSPRSLVTVDGGAWMVPLFPSMSVSKSTGPRIVESEGVGGEMSGGGPGTASQQVASVKMARVKWGGPGTGLERSNPRLAPQTARCAWFMMGNCGARPCPRPRGPCCLSRTGCRTCVSRGQPRPFPHRPREVRDAGEQKVRLGSWRLGSSVSTHRKQGSKVSKPTRRNWRTHYCTTGRMSARTNAQAAFPECPLCHGRLEGCSAGAESDAGQRAGGTNSLCDS